jgi:hypothetical protein
MLNFKLFWLSLYRGTDILFRQHFHYGMYIAKKRMAFSDPTPDGKSFATKYLGTNSFLVYKFGWGWIYHWEKNMCGNSWIIIVLMRGASVHNDRTEILLWMHVLVIFILKLSTGMLNFFFVCLMYPAFIMQNIVYNNELSHFPLFNKCTMY